MSYYLTVKQGNLLDAPKADFIVNPSNTLLQLGSGVSGAFAAACGPALQQAMAQALQTAQKLSAGDVVATPSAGCPQFRYILHTAIMDYRGDALRAAPTLQTVRKVLENIEKILIDDAKNRAGNPTLVLPLMGTGVGSLDKQQVLALYKAFFGRQVPVDCEVILYAHSERDYLLMKSMF